MDLNRAERIVYIIDDEPAVLSTLAGLIRTHGFCVSTYGDGEVFLINFEADRAACIVTDLRMPGLDGLAMLARLRDFAWAPPVVMISGAADVPLAVEAMKRGAMDFLRKPIRRDELLKAINAAVHVGEQRRSTSEHCRVVSERLATLTSKEWTVMELLLEGLQSKEIATQLDISVRTVQLRRHEVLRKLRVETVGELVAQHKLRRHHLEQQLHPVWRSGSRRLDSRGRFHA